MKQLTGRVLALNFKTYIEATGKKSIELARLVEKSSRETGVTIVVAPQFTDIKAVAESVDVPVFSQHIDPIRSGAHTGRILAEAVKSAGAVGTLLNHSERRLKESEVKEAIGLARDSNLITLVCADTPDAGAEIGRLGPDMIAIEPPDLIGTGVSVSKARPEVITEAVKKIRRVNSEVKILCGAGVTTPEDVLKALELGTEGVLVASRFVKSKDPGQVLNGMADAFLRHK